MAHFPGVPLILLASLALAALALAADTSAGGSGGPLLGGLEEVDVRDPAVQDVLDFAIRDYNSRNNDLFLHRVVRVVRAQRQVVAGLNYYLDVEIARTTCTKTQATVAPCPSEEQQGEPRRQRCSFEVNVVPWTHTISVLRLSCSAA